jgi:hypothetical protein
VRYWSSRLTRANTQAGWDEDERGRDVADATADGGRAELERRLIERSLEDEVFRQQLLADPRAIIEREIGTQLPEGLRVEAVEETADTIYLVLPSASPAGEGAELSDRELEAVAGGMEAFIDEVDTWPNACE